MRKFFIYPLLLLLVYSLSCTSKHGLEPVLSGIQGQIVFTGEWPAQPEEVRIVSATRFPPSDISDLDIGESVPHQVDSYSYTNYLGRGAYRMLGVIWREEGASWEFTSVCGLYFLNGDSLNPGIITIPTDTSMVQNINITVDRSRARRTSNSQIEGTVQFIGAWPDSFENAIVIASPKDPLVQSISILDFSYSAPISKGTRLTEYSIGVAPGLYKACGVIFFKENKPLTLDDMYYSQNINALVVRDLVVGNDETVRGPDFNLEIGPVSSAVTGTIRFTGEWPAKPEEVRIVASNRFPPELDDLIVGESIPFDAKQYTYTFNIRPDTLKLVGVVWRAEQTQFDLLSVCGVHFEGTDTLAPGEVVIPNDASVIQDIDIRVNRAKARVITDTRIAGSITFQGEWPPDIIEMRVIASTRFSLFPLELPSLFDLSFSELLPVGLDSIDYVIKAFPATFAATGVIFFHKGQTLTLDDILYSASVDGLDLTTYSVERDSTVKGPNFNIKF